MQLMMMCASPLQLQCVLQHQLGPAAAADVCTVWQQRLQVSWCRSYGAVVCKQQRLQTSWLAAALLLDAGTTVSAVHVAVMFPAGIYGLIGSSMHR
jgi:hypothetical protein